MAVYYILMALILGLAYPLCIRKPSQKKNTIYVCIVFGYMFLMSVFRYGIGNDFYNYRLFFYELCSSSLSFPERFADRRFEIGYTVIMEIARLLGGDYLILNFIMALLILFPVAFVIVKYSKMPWLSCWLYLTVTFFYNSLNFTRQSLAASIVLLSYYFIKEKKHWAVILLALAGSLFHMSVLIFIPVYLMSLIKPSAKLYAAVGAAAVPVFVFSDKLLRFLLTKVVSGYSEYLDTIFLNVGLSRAFLIVPFLFMVLGFAAYFSGWKDKCSEAGVFTNFLFYNFLIWLFITKHFILERFTLPIYIFIILSIPEMMCHFKEIRFKPAVQKGSHFKEQVKEGTIKSYLSFALKNGKRLWTVLTGAVLLMTFSYNDMCINEGVHGVFPYESVFDAASEYSSEQLRTDYRKIFPAKSFQKYLSLINKGDYTTVICVNGDAGSSLDLSAKLLLRKLGFKTDLNKLDGQSYIGVVSGGKVVFEKTSDDVIEEKLAICDNSVFITAVSGGLRAEKQIGQVYVGDDGFTPNLNGLNFAVFDNELKMIAAAQTYDTTGYDYIGTDTTAFYGELLIEE
ncbi:MAG: EpsG family protein [Huintestinicola sp.]|uniref:EpsG family protein n=1 Tax=Huintestinicola sp. TaxID=2981661 RepID=UPI003F0C022D